MSAQEKKKRSKEVSLHESLQRNMSLRNIKFMFDEGERVLCYEPDPNKAKVLYDSKILACTAGPVPGNPNKKRAEYLVHFSGWNSSWDRLVAEENILKDTPTNRALQRLLAEAAAQNLKGKKLKLNKIPSIIKDVVVSQSPGGEESSKSQKWDQLSEEFSDRLSSRDHRSRRGDDSDASDSGEDEDGRVRSSRRSVSMRGTESINGDMFGPEPVAREGGVVVGRTYKLWVVPGPLKRVLEKDYTRVTGGNSETPKLYPLPFKPNVLEIIESYCDSSFPEQVLTSHADAKKSSSVSSSSAPSGSATSNLTGAIVNQLRNHELLKEFKSSFLIYFDTLMTNGYLFYNDAEMEQLQQSREVDSDSCLEDDADDWRPAVVYGFIHLCRFLTLLPDFLGSTPTMSRKQMRLLVLLHKNLISFLNSNVIHLDIDIPFVESSASPEEVDLDD